MNVDRRGRLVGVPRLDEQLLGCSATAFSAPSSAFFLTPSGLIFVSELCSFAIQVEH